MYKAQLLIEGRDVDASNGAAFERKNPVTGEVATRAASASVADANAAVDAAARAFPAWSSLGPGARRQKLSAAAAALRGVANELAARVSAETGATLGWGHFNVFLAASMLDEAAALTTQVAGEVIPSDHPGVLALAVRQPAGVVLGMAPWNAPVILGVRALATPLACGNTVVLKASEQCPATHRLIVEALSSALPAGVVNVVIHSAENAPAIVEALIAHPAVRRVNFTGSTRVGRIVGSLAGKHLKPVVLELGGKAPLVVLDDADIGAAVDAAVFGSFMNQGQICMSTERIVVDQKIADEFVTRFRDRVAALRVGPPTDPQTQIGALVDGVTSDKLRTLIADAVERGAKVVVGGAGEGAYFKPTVVDGVTRDMKLFREESFGPVVGVIRVADVEEAIATANDSEYGLSAAVFGRDVGRALQVAKRIDSGICHINSATVGDEAQMPFGGTKASGVGRFGGRAGIHEFTDLRWITVSTEARHYPI
ncbi:MAG: aldehyde dehydrogenase [Polyangiales bacterium]